MAPMLAVDLATVVLLALRVTHGDPGSPGEMVRAVLLIACALACAGAVRGNGGVGPRSCRGWTDISMVWVLAAALALSPAAAVVTSVAVRLLAWSGDRGPRRSWHRLLHDISTTVLACLVAGLALQLAASRDDAATAGLVGRGPLPLVVAMLAFAATIAVGGRFAAGIRIGPVTSPVPATPAEARWDTIAVEVALLGSGALVAVAVHINPPLVLLTALPLALICRHLPARPAALTPLLPAPVWCAAAEDGLRRARNAGGSSVLVLVEVIRLGPISAVHGRSVAAVVRRDVAEAVRSCVRADDIVGSWGRSGIVVLLAGGARTAAGHSRELPSVPVLLERIRAALATLQLAVATADGPLSLGRADADLAAVTAPRAGAGLLQLLGAVEIELAEREPLAWRAERPSGHSDPA